MLFKANVFSNRLNILVIILSFLLFTYWIYHRSSIFSSNTLWPTEKLSVYFRDGYLFYFALRYVFAFLWCMGLYIWYNSGSPKFLLLSASFYFILFLIDSSLIIVKYIEYTHEATFSDISFPTQFLSGLIEAPLILCITFILVKTLNRTNKSFSFIK